MKAGSLLLFDLGFTNFQVFAELTEAKVTFITRAKSNLSYQVKYTLFQTATVQDEVVWIGSREQRQEVRLVKVLYRGNWYRYLSNELDDKKLPVRYLVSLYWQRWRIEDAYNTVKRLLGLAYFWGGAQNAVEMQVAATWILFAVLVDLTDAVAEALNKRFSALSLEMVFHSLPYFAQAYHQQKATDVVLFLAANAERYGILKRRRNRDKPSIFVSLWDLTNAAIP